MPDKRLIIDQLKLSYEGLFNASELYRLIDSWFYEKGWDKVEKMNQEMLTPEGKQIRILMEPYKNITDYFKLVIRIKITLTDVKDVEVEKDGELLRLNQGLVRFIFDGYVITDRKALWESTPFLWFMRTIFDRYVFKQQSGRAERWLRSDLDDLHTKIKTFLNTTQYTYTLHTEE